MCPNAMRAGMLLVWVGIPRWRHVFLGAGLARRCVRAVCVCAYGVWGDVEGNEPL